MSERYYPASLPSQALTRQLSQRESHWHVGQLSSGRAKPDITQKIVPCYRGQQLRNHVPCQAAASLGSRALLFAIQIKLYSSSMGLTDTPVPLPLGATATTAASGGNREELLGPRPAGCERQRSRRWEPQPGQCHPKVTERAFASRYRSYPPYISRRQTISKPLARALLRLY